MEIQRQAFWIRSNGMRQKIIKGLLFSAMFLAFLDKKFKLQQNVNVSDAVPGNTTR